MVFVWILIGVIGRVIIHVPDVTPITTLSLLAPYFFSKRFSIVIIISTLILSDFMLHIVFQYPLFGLWTLFSYSGWISIIFFGSFFLHQLNITRACVLTFFSSLFFWVWTNFGTWLTTHIYTHSFSGFMQCYLAALPFLKNSLIGSIIYTLCIVFLFNRSKKEIMIFQ